jgi:K+-transporting ATPase ATPase C chain
MFREFKRGILFTIVSLVLFGGIYPVALWMFGRVAFPAQAEGSLIRSADGTIIGSRLIAQAFTGPGYFHPRPSAVAYNAAATGGTNYGPSTPEHLALVRERLDRTLALEHASADQVPSEMITASGGGLDPDIPPPAAALQASRVASTRGVTRDRVQALVDAHTKPPAFGLFGLARVNVLELNLALDEAFGAPSPAGSR